MTRAQVRRISGATVVALVALVGCSLLGLWQYSRAHRDDISKRVLAAAAVPVQSLETPGNYVPEQVFSHSVMVRGRLGADQALLTCARVEHGQPGCWIIAPVALSPTIASVVVLGFASDANAPAALAALRASGSSSVELTGRLQPAEVMDNGLAILRPATQVPYINVNELSLRWQTNLLDGYVVLTAPPAGLQSLTSPPILPPSGITWRNLFYAWQWWTFAAFIVFLLGRYIVDVRAEQHTIDAPAPEEQQ